MARGDRPAPEYQRCPKCSGSGWVQRKCPQCNGRGTIGKDRFRNDITCGQCGGVGTVEDACGTCGGAGEILVRR